MENALPVVSCPKIDIGQGDKDSQPLMVDEGEYREF